ncbi:MAG: bifunctional anthranilate synthase component II/anthranilate phosphoribosyltransferase [Candidatus Alcyoniella australis]|nr:bifunctional anthranilate synthase component II/anthranilate phosphoribosyltransferase [Candidatus Alcyoniella australis]
MIAVIDNYDSFVYNLVQLFRSIGSEVRVFRNDALSVEQLRDMNPSQIVISPGPCTPDQAGISVDVIRKLGPQIPILGVCLGHEAMGAAFGARLMRSHEIVHGKSSEVKHDGRSLFQGLDSPMTVGRYHSLELDPDTIPDELEVSAWTGDGSVMAVRHRRYPLEGVQFHPESVLTPQGRWLCENFLHGGRPRTTLKAAIGRVVDGRDLARPEAEDVMKQILSGAATPAQIAALIIALRLKGETVEEVAGCAKVMREFAAPLRAPAVPLLDTCGTGGDGGNTFNISTAAAFVAAGAGCKVAKHGNRAVSSRCGSADVLLELGVNINCGRELTERALDEAGIAFLFAPAFHAAMKHAIGPRREIGVRTLFNILGPLTNPAGATRQLIGVYDPRLTKLVAGVLAELGSERALVVHGADGLDEITLSGSTRVTELKNGRIETFEIKPSDFGLEPCSASEMAGGVPRTNASILRSILEGRRGPTRDVVLLNAGAALACAGQADDLQQGIAMARESIDSGRARIALDRLVEITNG